MASTTDKQITFIKQMRDKGDLTWQEIADEFENFFGERKTPNAIRKTHDRYKNVEDLNDDLLLKNLQSTQTAKKRAARLNKENKVLAENLITADEIIQEFKERLPKLPQVKLPKLPKKNKAKDNMVIEPMLSDLHLGLKTKSFDENIARKRLQKYGNTIIDEIYRNQKNYNITKINILGLADYMQSATMHKDSHLSCHLTNAQQLALAVEAIFYDVLLPVGRTGLPIDFIAMCGNHDREATEQFTVNPGITYYSYTVYKCLEFLCKQSGLKNVKFVIPKDHHYVYSIFGSYFLLEHGYLVRKLCSSTMEAEIIKRSGQEGKIIDGIRIGHYHTDFVQSCGRYISNGGLPSDDHFSGMLGYQSRPCQVINYYVETENRSTPYYHSFVVNLGE